MSDKNCGNCKYRMVREQDKPCSDCYDSFCGKPFETPSNWEKVDEFLKEEGNGQSINK